MNLLNGKTYFFIQFSITFFSLPATSLKAQTTAKFEHITLEDGLSKLNAITIIQDRNIFMWFGTRDRLNRYDGNSFKIYKNDPKNSRSISNNFIPSIFEDRQETSSIGTLNGG